jgi:hypothetical protein
MIKIILNNINKNTFFTNNFTYLIVGEVHVLNGISLYIEDNTTILLRNCININNVNRSTDYSTLIFDTGSTVIAKKLFIKSVDKNNKKVKYADNGGLIFLGSTVDTQYKLYNTISSQLSPITSNYSIEELIIEYLGSVNNNNITIIGVNNNEFNIKKIKSFYSGNIGLNIINSTINIDRLYINNPMGNIGIENNNSIININKSLKITITNNKMASLFNFIVNSLTPNIKINKKANIYLKAPHFNTKENPLVVVSTDIILPTSPYFVIAKLLKQIYIFREI